MIMSEYEPHICHISILNPLLHTRIYYKLALSQRKAGYRVSVIAQGASGVVEGPSGIEMVDIGNFERLSIRRLCAPLWLLIPALKQKANVYVIHTPELLPLAWVLRKIRRAVIFYDMHENYAENLTFGAHWPKPVGKWLAARVRKREIRASRWLAGVTFAERVFIPILPLERKKRFLLENLFSQPVSRQEHMLPVLPPRPYLLYSGTLAAERGLWDTLDLWEQLAGESPYQLVIAGHTHNAELLSQLHERIEKSPFSDRIHLVGGAQFVPYTHMIHLIRHAEAGTALYHPQPQNLGRFPTKLFEYMAAGVPLIFWPQPEWEIRNAETPFGVSWKPGQPVLPLISLLQSWQKPALPAEAYAWEAVEPAYLDWLQKRLASSIR